MITELFAFVVTDARGEEGVLRRKTEIGTQPMIADSRQRLEAFRPFAAEMAQEMGCTLNVARFLRQEQGR